MAIDPRDSVNVRIHAFEPVSRANGPGRRAVVWFQGCNLGCGGCFNPTTHAANGGKRTDTEELANRILAASGGLEGVTISGGEPFQQAEALLDLLERLNGSGLGRLVFSGYSLAEIERMPLGLRILGQLDALIAGRYVTGRPLGRGLVASANQEVVLSTARYSREMLERVPVAEAIVGSDGTLRFSGLRPVRLRSKAR